MKTPCATFWSSSISITCIFNLWCSFIINFPYHNKGCGKWWSYHLRRKLNLIEHYWNSALRWIPWEKLYPKPVKRALNSKQRILAKLCPPMSCFWMDKLVINQCIINPQKEFISVDYLYNNIFILLLNLGLSCITMFFTFIIRTTLIKNYI